MIRITRRNAKCCLFFVQLFVACLRVLCLVHHPPFTQQFKQLCDTKTFSYRNSAADDDGKFTVSENPLAAFKDNVTVLFESDRILVIDKPPAISHHDGNDGELGVLSLLRQAQACGRLKYQGRLYGVHRLDRVTSGILVLAKDADMASMLTQAFRNGNVIKYYVGVSSKKRSKKKQGWVKGSMVRGRRKSWYLTRDNEASSNNNVAVTRFFTASLASLRESAANVSTPPMTCVLFRPYTGRTHQLRVAAKSVALPLLGDPIYADGSDSNLEERTCLHACAIHIDLEDADSVTVWSPLPFNHLYRTMEGKNGLNATVMQLLKTHCDCDHILPLMNG